MSCIIESFLGQKLGILCLSTLLRRLFFDLNRNGVLGRGSSIGIDMADILGHSSERSTAISLLYFHIVHELRRVRVAHFVYEGRTLSSFIHSFLIKHGCPLAYSCDLLLVQSVLNILLFDDLLKYVLFFPGLLKFGQ